MTDNTKYLEIDADTLGTNNTQPYRRTYCSIKSFIILYRTTEECQSPTCDNV